MADGNYVPALFDGMGTFPGPDGSIIVLRNHEYREDNDKSIGAFKGRKKLSEKIPAELYYDAGTGDGPCLGAVTTLVYDPQKGKTVREFLSLAGTMTNCSGCVTPWGTWLSCEESRENAGGRYARNHGYVFEVTPSAAPGLQPPVLLPALGRFVHEGAIIDPVSGIVYMTEDKADSLIYRFLPQVPGQLTAGGRLQCLAIQGRPRLDTRNWVGQPVTVGEPLQTYWINLDDVESEQDDLRIRGARSGGARFARGEGICRLEESVYFGCTSGGARRLGQVWRYTPDRAEDQDPDRRAGGLLELVAEPNDSKVLENPDQFATAPWGDLLICEDGKNDQYLLGMTPGGQFYPFARNARDQSELSGACFSPDGEVLFLSNMVAGLTFAITGPWPKRSVS